MAEALKRWDGTQWVTVVAVNRMVIQTGEPGLIGQPKYITDWPIPLFNNSYDTLTPRSKLAIGYSYTIT